MMSRIKWDEKYFEESGLYVWIYNKGHVESTNEKFYKSSLRKIYEKREKKSDNKKNERDKNEN